MATAINEDNAGEIIDVAIRLFKSKAPESTDHAFESELLGGDGTRTIERAGDEGLCEYVTAFRENAV